MQIKLFLGIIPLVCLFGVALAAPVNDIQARGVGGVRDGPADAIGGGGAGGAEGVESQGGAEGVESQGGFEAEQDGQQPMINGGEPGPDAGGSEGGKGAVPGGESA
ncbi:hypothetical protein PS15m_010379 [Mucor circinelloides]